MIIRSLPFRLKTPLVAAVLVLLAHVAIATEPLFPRPLHLTRQIQDPLAGETVTLDEYCSGDRVISIRGTRVSISDYAHGELTEIDRFQNTYSVTEFSQVARARSSVARIRSQKVLTWKRQQLPSRGVAGRTVEVVELRAGEASDLSKVEVAFDRNVVVSRAAAEVLIGAAFPNVRRPEHDAILNQATDAIEGKLAPMVPLPLEQVFEFESSGETIRVTNRVTRIGNELAPAEILTIPAGARMVESTVVTRQRLLEELDRLPSSSKH